MDRASVWLHGVEKVYHKDDFDVFVEAEDFDLKNDFKFQLVCGVCNSPATFVSKKNGQKYFRHPKRTTRELAEKDKLCERRSNSVNPLQIRKYNEIIEQTTLGEILSNFYELIGNLNNLNEEQLERTIVGSKNKDVRKAFAALEKTADLSAKSFIEDKKNKEQLELAKERLKLNRNERFQRYKESWNKNNSLIKDERKVAEENYVAFSLDVILDPANQLLNDLAYKLYKYEEDPNLFDIEVRKTYPLLNRHQLDVYPRLFGMLMHPRSIDMRYFFIFLSLCCDYVAYEESGINRNSFGQDKSYQKFKYFLTDFVVSVAFKDKLDDKKIKSFLRVNSKKELLLRIDESGKLLNDLIGIYTIQLRTIPQIIADELTKYKVDGYYKALAKTNAERSEKSKGLGGWIYIATNNSLTKRGIKNEIKIGKTQNKPRRLAQYQFASADGFIYEKIWRVNNRHKAEKFIHRALQKFNIENENGGKEWYELTPQEGIEKVSELINTFEKKYGYFEKLPDFNKGFG